MIKIESRGNRFSFITHLPETIVTNIFSAAGISVEQEQYIIERPAAGNEFAFQNEQDEDFSSDRSVSKILYSEVKKMGIKFDELLKIIPDRTITEMYCDDIYTLSAICGMAKRKLSDNEMLFICMAISVSEEHNPSADAINFLEEVEKHDSFPHHVNDLVNRKNGKNY